MNAVSMSTFTPSLMAPESLEATFVQRHELAERLVGLIRESALTESKHHVLLVGPRGIGKTHLVSLVYHRVARQEELRDRLVIAWLREEEWGVSSFLDVLLRILRALAEGDPRSDLAERVGQLYDFDPETSARHAAELLEEYVGARTLLVLMENLDGVFDGLSDEGQKRLRAYIQEHPYWTILASAQSLFGGVSLQTSPFYGFFRIEHLSPLDLEEAIELLSRIAGQRGDAELAQLIQSPLGRARVRAVHHLAGGNHRVYVIFSQFLTCESLDQLVDAVMRTIDELTPYYQSRMVWLAPQQRKIVELLCERRGAVQVKEIAKSCFLTHQATSSQLKSLREYGYVTSTTLGRESYYELREPLMRICIEVKKQRGDPIQLFVGFLRVWYTAAELKQRLEMVEYVRPTEQEYIQRALRACEDESEDPKVTACLSDLREYFDREDFARGLEVADELVAIRGWARDYATRGLCLAQLGRREEGVSLLDQGVELAPADPEVWHARGITLLKLGRVNDALASFKKQRELDPEDVAAWGNQGVALLLLGRPHEALESVRRVLELAPWDAKAWRNCANSLAQLGRFQEALESYDRAVELDAKDPAPWAGRVVALTRLERLEEALASSDRALALGFRDPQLPFTRIQILCRLSRWDNVTGALDNALGSVHPYQTTAVRACSTIPRRLLKDVGAIANWSAYVRGLLDIFDKHNQQGLLSAGVTLSISGLPDVASDLRYRWRDVWVECAGSRATFGPALRLLDAAIRFLDSKDEKELLMLAAEEREVVQQLLRGGSKSDDHELLIRLRGDGGIDGVDLPESAQDGRSTFHHVGGSDAGEKEKGDGEDGVA